MLLFYSKVRTKEFRELKAKKNNYESWNFLSWYSLRQSAYLVSSCVVPVHFGDRHLWKETQFFGSQKNYLKSKEPGVNAAQEM